ncbi:hypothetical protein [Coleofasciculus sp. E1-EBD-02]|jgi:hypothetical protein|uniref:hypothetical protein n=1 Tax=Coleofasciculus sp. E1-EBD-02 TaxID=3068481 RepID=UPI0032FA8862
MKSKLALYNKIPIYIQVTIGIFLLTGIGLAERLLRHPQPQQWKNASKIIDSGLLTKIAQDNTTDNINPETIKAMSLGDGIYLIDFNTPQLCGRAGCLYVAYTKQGDRIFNLILQPQSDLFRLNSSDPTRTCLNIRQPKGNQTLIHTYCHEGDKFIKTITSATN